MEPSYEDIRRLYIEKISGVISEADSALLASWLATDIKAQQIWQTLEKEGRQLNLSDFMEGIDSGADLLQVKQRAGTLPTRRVIPFMRYAAAMTFFLLVGAGFFILRKTDRGASLGDDPITFAASVEDSPYVQLSTDDGQSVNLQHQTTIRALRLNGIAINASASELESIHSDAIAVVMSTLSVPAKGAYKVTLPDGSKVWLNAESKLRFPSRFIGGSREVYLDGEGYFEVTTDLAKPFIVHAGDTKVRVLGTRFNLRTYEQQAIQTALVDGSVQLTTENGESMRLEPGYAATYNGKGFSKASFDATEILAWMDGVHYFHNASLEELAKTINRWYGLSVTFENPQLVHQTITGLMEKDDIAYFLADLKSSTGIKHRLVGDVLYLK
ncbi:FecR family protein [Parapedobacter tibetensis]|uniref:FecR family protein n=1 Tax=Parapedobacter tibetensis TaxID=2972951 RepID=UPI00214DA0C3|nr:FecR domain-containing protein [Parapedobacter tibetensis]